jgi:hypothetical protein
VKFCKLKNCTNEENYLVFQWILSSMLVAASIGRLFEGKSNGAEAVSRAQTCQKVTLLCAVKRKQQARIISTPWLSFSAVSKTREGLDDT